MSQDELPVTFDDSLPVSSQLQNVDQPTLIEESEVWRCRAHELWLAAAASGDLRAQAAALQVAFRGLESAQKAMEAEAQKAAQAAAIDPAAPFGRNEVGQPYLLTPEISDEILRRVDAAIAEFSREGGDSDSDNAITD